MTFAPHKRHTQKVLLNVCLLILLFAWSTTSTSVAYAETTYSESYERLDPVEVFISNKRVGSADTFDVAIQIGDVSNLGITAFTMAVAYDTNLVSVASVTIDGTLSGPGAANMTLAVNDNGEGRLALAAAGVDALVGAGNIAIVKLAPKGVDGVMTLSFEEAILNEGTPVASGVDGVITLTALLPGDASMNGEATAFDASLVLKHITELDTLSIAAQIAADVSASGDLSAYDASLLLQYAAGLIDCFPVEGCGVLKRSAEAKAELAWGEVAPDGMLVYVPLEISKIEGPVYALSVEVIATEAFDFTYDLETRLLDGWVIMHNLDNDGVLRLSMAGNSPLQEGMVLAITSSEQVSDLTTHIQLNEGQFDSLEQEDVVETPDSFVLEQNFPNPFNPETRISYSLQEDSLVSLVVYDMLGREVKRLVSEHQKAGNHSFAFSGENLASGIYLYKLTAGENTQTRQMTLLK